MVQRETRHSLGRDKWRVAQFLLSCFPHNFSLAIWFNTKGQNTLDTITTKVTHTHKYDQTSGLKQRWMFILLWVDQMRVVPLCAFYSEASHFQNCYDLFQPSPLSKAHDFRLKFQLPNKWLRSDLVSFLVTVHANNERLVRKHTVNRWRQTHNQRKRIQVKRWARKEQQQRGLVMSKLCKYICSCSHLENLFTETTGTKTMSNSWCKITWPFFLLLVIYNTKLITSTLLSPTGLE